MQQLYWIVVFGMVVRCREERHSIIFSLNFSLCMYLCLGTMALTIVFLGVYLLVSLSPTFFFFFLVAAFPIYVLEALSPVDYNFSP